VYSGGGGQVYGIAAVLVKGEYCATHRLMAAVNAKIVNRIFDMNSLKETEECRSSMYKYPTLCHIRIQPICILPISIILRMMGGLLI
jgi:hypothetical protein